MTKVVKTKGSYINREISWLQFNARVLQEAADKKVPLIERLRFLGIFSNNLDEFFKVRYATIKRIERAGKGGKNQLGGIKASELLEIITQTVIKQQSESLNILIDIETELKNNNIFIINELEIDDDQRNFIKTYFYQFVSPALVTIILSDDIDLPLLEDSAAYLAVKMTLENNDKQYALIEIPGTINRFVELPKRDNKDYIIMLDDLLRYFLDDIFSVFDYHSVTAHMIKMTRDAELDFDNDISTSFLKKISDSVKHREIGQPVRFVYDKNIDEDTLIFLMRKMGIDSTDSIIPGGRYHNRRDYMKFPSLGRQELHYERIDPLPIKGLSFRSSIFQAISKKRLFVIRTISYIFIHR